MMQCRVNSSLSEDGSTNKSCKEALCIIDKILKNKIKIDAKESERSSNIVTDFLKDITPAFKKDAVFRSMYFRDYKTGSSYNELRISNASEYDIEIVFRAPAQIHLEVEFFPETMTFAKLKWNKIGDFPPNKLDILHFFEKNSENGYLKPLKISAWFQGLIDVYLKSNPMIPGIKKMRNSQSGPARTIEIETVEGYQLSIDLLPAFTFSFDSLIGTKINNILEKYPVDKSKKFWFLVPKICKGEVPLLASQCDFSWRVDFPEVERKVLFNKLSAKNVVKLLKLLRDIENWNIASYHLKTLILWAIDANPKTDYWQGSYLFDRYLETMTFLQKCLEKQFLPYFMDDSYNLFHVLNKDECKNVSNRLKHLIGLIKSDYNNLNVIYK
ncbi:cyclic GMP-AMP synthase-like receptor [Argiope bruennichi]|uniref:cyclic GMP-AMP synthase-like receptor n=1 Tax=Argiope bruennichi TaxID=94029 RepID=UPI002494E28A|nr:cyclic GMP-AMP synthase-like receptor [Argiope bruennichi]